MDTVEYQKAYEMMLRARERAKASYQSRRKTILEKKKLERSMVENKNPVGRPRKVKVDESI